MIASKVKRENPFRTDSEIKMKGMFHARKEAAFIVDRLKSKEKLSDEEVKQLEMYEEFNEKCTALIKKWRGQ